MCLKLYRSAHSVLHVEVISHSDDKYSFGTHLFNGEEELVKHLEQETPVIGGDSGKMLHSVKFLWLQQKMLTKLHYF